MELIFVFSVVLIQILLFHFFKIVEIVRTFGTDAFVYTEELAVFFGNQGIAAMRTDKADRSCNHFSRCESLTTDLALVLTIATIIVIDEKMGSTTQRADGILGNGFAVATLNRLNWFAVFPVIVFQKELPVLFDKRFYNRELVNLKLLVLWRVRIIESPLFQRYISANKVNKPAVLLVKVLNCLK